MAVKETRREGSKKRKKGSSEGWRPRKKAIRREDGGQSVSAKWSGVLNMLRKVYPAVQTGSVRFVPVPSISVAGHRNNPARKNCHAARRSKRDQEGVEGNETWTVLRTRSCF